MDIQLFEAFLGLRSKSRIESIHPWPATASGGRAVRLCIAGLGRPGSLLGLESGVQLAPDVC